MRKYCFLIYLLFVFQAQAEMSLSINGIVFEGGEYSGKTSIAEQLTHELKARNIRIKKNHAVLTRDPLIKYLAQKAFNSLPKQISHEFPDPNFFKEFNKLRTEQLILDALFFKFENKEPINTFYIQDRYLFTQIFLNRFFTPEQFDFEEEWLLNNQASFAYKIYLTCSSEVRKDRALRRDVDVNVGIIDEYFLYHLDKWNTFDQFCIDAIHPDKEWIIIDTSQMTIAEIVDFILNEILKLDNYATHPYL